MNNLNNNDDLFTASLESIKTDKRVEKFERFKNDFIRECNITLDNAQEWIKAELPMVADYIDHTAIKDELRQPKVSDRRKYLLSALMFEKNLREAIENNNADSAAIMAMHMFNHMWLAKVETHGIQSVASANTSTDSVTMQNSDVDTQLETREKILTTLIKKGEQLKKDSQIQSQIRSQIQSKIQKKQEPIKNINTAKPKPALQTPITKKPSFGVNKKADLWTQEAEKAKEKKRFESLKTKKQKKKSNGVLSKVKTKFPLKRKTKDIAETKKDSVIENKPEDSLLDDPNRSAIVVSTGFSDSIDDSLIQARKNIPDDPNASGVTVHKVLKARDHKKQDPGSNTIIMKLASNSGIRKGEKLSIPEQCQEAINMLTQQFPGYDMVAIRNLAAEKVGVSPQYIENLNILPDKTG